MFFNTFMVIISYRRLLQFYLLRYFIFYHEEHEGLEDFIFHYSHYLHGDYFLTPYSAKIRVRVFYLLFVNNHRRTILKPISE